MSKETNLEQQRIEQQRIEQQRRFEEILDGLRAMADSNNKVIPQSDFLPETGAQQELTFVELGEAAVATRETQPDPRVGYFAGIRGYKEVEVENPRTEAETSDEVCEGIGAEDESDESPEVNPGGESIDRKAQTIQDATSLEPGAKNKPLSTATLRRIGATSTVTMLSLAFFLINSSTGADKDAGKVNTTISYEQPSAPVPGKDNLAGPDCGNPAATIVGQTVGNIMVPFRVKGSSAVMKVQVKGQDGKVRYPQIDSKLTATLGFCIPSQDGTEQQVGNLSADGKTVTIPRESFSFNTVIPPVLQCDKSKAAYACVSGISRDSYEKMRPKLSEEEYARLLPLVVPEAGDTSQAKRFSTFAALALVRSFTDYIDDAYKNPEFTNVLDSSLINLLKEQAPGVKVELTGAYANPKFDFRKAHDGLSNSTFGWVEKASGSAVTAPYTIIEKDSVQASGARK